MKTASFLICITFVGCSLFRTNEPDTMTCSPKADLWYEQQLDLWCKDVTIAECPASEALGDEFEVRRIEECN